MKSVYLLILLVLVLVIAGCSGTTTQPIGHGLSQSENAAANKESKVLAGNEAKYMEFSKKEYDQALKNNKKILLNFYANWCPLCAKEQPEAFAAFNEIHNSDIIGFRVNYKDSETDVDEENLAREFGITYQHTKVILVDGKKVLKSPDSWDKQRYLDELAKV